ncbi:MAG: hypothetical protein AAGG38_13470 [Planctomycetota bacterium]
MSTFTDTNNRTWSIDPVVSTLKRVKRLTNDAVDLYRLDDEELIRKLRTDPYLLVDTLFAAVQPQAEAAGVSDEAFAASLGGDTLERATAALLEAVADFFPSRKAQVLKKSLAKMRQTEDVFLEAAESQVEVFDAEEAARQELDALKNSGG